MHYREFLGMMHERLAPRTYLEIGVQQGHSLALSRCPSIGIDPSLAVNQELHAPATLICSTSDQYFERLAGDGLTPFGALPIDFAFIDGMHQFEYALRDFIGVERYSAPTSVVAFDDMLPRNVDEAARQRHTVEWTGDVFRVQSALAAHRPDLVQIQVDTEPTGTLLVVGLDPSNRELTDRLGEITRAYVKDDPQELPAEIVGRTGAIAPQQALGLTIWDDLRSARHVAEVAAGDPAAQSSR
jgi:Methyltransferase domain